MKYMALAFGLLFAKFGFAMDMEVRHILQVCAPSVNEQTMASIINAESGGYVYAVADAGPVKLPWKIRKKLVKSYFPENRASAVELAKQLIADGHTVSLGPGQLNDRNLKKYGMTINDAFDICKNLTATSQLLTEYYSLAALEYGKGNQALIAAISAFNSGSFTRGLSDGYVQLVFEQTSKDLTFKFIRKPTTKAKKIIQVREFGITVIPYKVVKNE